MEFFEYITYTLIFLVLMAFIGVISYVIYDNYTYKNNLTSDLNTNFVDINQNFDSTSNIINKLYSKHSSNINVIDARVYENSNLFAKDIEDLNSRHTASRNLITDINSKHTASSNLFTKNTDTFSYNLNKYFTFSNTLNTNFNDTNNKIFEYRTFGDTVSKLDLITKTTATAGLKVNSDINKEFEICNSTGTKCFQMYSDDDNLFIYGKNANSSNIYIGGNNKNTAPIRIEDGVVKLNDIYGSNYTQNTSNFLIDYINYTSNKIMSDVNAIRDKQITGAIGPVGPAGPKGDTGLTGPASGTAGT